MTIDVDLLPASKVKRLPRRSQAERGEMAGSQGGLTAGDLIAMLEHLDPATPIVIEGQYGGYASVRRIAQVALKFNVNDLEGFGPHDRVSPGEPPEARAAAVLVRPSTHSGE
jgi:hypothetical protein